MSAPYAIAAARPGGSEVLHRIALDPPPPGPGEVLLRHTAVGVNFIDVYFRQGLYPWPVETDLILGSEGAGVVEALGAGVSGFEPGDRVAYTIQNGGYATHRLAPADRLVPIPDGISDEQAAAAMLKGLTAHYLIHDSYHVREGDTVLVHAAAGGVGLILGQWLKARGVRAIGAAGGAEKCALAASHGYGAVIDYRAEDFVARVREITDGAGVAAVYDSVGADTIMGSIDCLANFGTLVSFGQSSGAPDQVRIAHLARGSLKLTRPSVFHHIARPGWLPRAAAALFDIIGTGAVDLQVNWRAPLAEAAEVHRALEARRTTGCTVLLP